MESQLTKWGRAAAIGILLVVSGAVVVSYYQRTHLFKQPATREGRMLPENVAMHTRGFYYSQSEKGQISFDVTADVNLGYKDNKNLLEKVQVRILGKSGNRYDTITSQRCEFDQTRQDIIFLGKVVITLSSLTSGENLGSKKPGPGNNTVLSLDRIRYSQDTGNAETEDLVRFSRGLIHGSARGLTYETRTEAVFLRSQVDITMEPARPGEAPTRLRCESLKYAKNLHLIEMRSQVSVSRASQELRADLAYALLSPDDSSLTRIDASGAVETVSRDPRHLLQVDAQRMSCLFDREGRFLDKVLASQDVRTRSLDPAVKRNVSANDMELIFKPGTNLLGQLKASGQVHGVFSDEKIAPREVAPTHSQEIEPGDKVMDASVMVVFFKPDGKQASRIEAQGSCTLREFPIRAQDENRVLSAMKFQLYFAPDVNQMDRFTAAGQVKVDLISQDRPARHTFSDRLEARFEPQTRQISQLVQSGHFLYLEGRREARAEEAHYSAASGITLLQGLADMRDDQGRTTADEIELHRNENLVKARGTVHSVLYAQNSAGPAGAFKPGSPVFASADFMESQTEKGTARYRKRAKLWQDDQIISAETIDLYRDEKRLVAENEVTTLFYPKTDHQQTSGPSGSGPVKVQAHKLTYEDKLQRMLYETKVSMNSSMGRVTCDRLEIFLNREEKQTSVERMLAQGSVHIEQQGRTSSSSLAEFFSADNLVVLTGGQPKITDPARGFTTGARLTMHLNDDRLSVEGEPENRTITRQNVAR